MNVNKEIIFNDIDIVVADVIRSNKPHSWIYTEEPFQNVYKNQISFDNSGEVVALTLDALSDIKNRLGQTNLPYYPYSSILEELLSSIYINRWEASYESNRGKDWIDYFKLVEDKYTDYKCENFVLYDEDGNDLNEDLDAKLNDIFYEYFENKNIEFYYEEIIKTVDL